MPRYYAERKAQTEGVHEVTTGGCGRLPDNRNHICLGDILSFLPAVAEARKDYDEYLVAATGARTAALDEAGPSRGHAVASRVHL